MRVRRYIQRDSSGPTDAHTLQTTHCDCCQLRFFGAILRNVACRYEELLRRTDEVHRTGILRGDQLPWQRQTDCGQPNFADRIFHLDSERQAQPRLPGSYGGRRRTYGAHFETWCQSGGVAEMFGVPRVVHKTGTTWAAIRNCRGRFLRELPRARIGLAWGAYYDRLGTPEISAVGDGGNSKRNSSRGKMLGMSSRHEGEIC